MGRNSRKRINISVGSEEYGRLESIRESYGFRSVCSLARTVLAMLARYVVEGEARQRQTPSTGDEIIDMFNEYGDWERTPFNTPPPYRRRRDKDEEG